MAIKLILIRHGESDSNVQNRFCGFKDVNLTKKGIEQAERLSYRLKGVPVDQVYCSDLKRAQHTAEIIFKDRGIDIVIDPKFKEINFGIWEGYTFEEVKLKYGYGDEFNLWFENINGKTNLSKGESLIDLNHRVMTGLDKILKKEKQVNQDKTIALVCHGGTIRVILGNALNLELKYIWNIEQNSTALNIINYYDHRTFITLINDTSHLQNWWESGWLKDKRDE